MTKQGPKTKRWTSLHLSPEHCAIGDLIRKNSHGSVQSIAYGIGLPSIASVKVMKQRKRRGTIWSVLYSLIYSHGFDFSHLLDYDNEKTKPQTNIFCLHASPPIESGTYQKSNDPIGNMLEDPKRKRRHLFVIS